MTAKPSNLDGDVRHFRLDDLPLQPWRNRGGVTREILVHPAPKSGEAVDWDWRVSVADNERPGAFSTFPGVNRSALLFDGHAIELHDDSREAVMRFAQPGDIHHFPGEATLSSRLGKGVARLLNVMTRRDSAQAQLLWQKGGLSISLSLNESQACVLLGAKGRWRVRVQAAASAVAYELDAGSGLHITGLNAHVYLQGLQPESALAQVVFMPV